MHTSKQMTKAQRHKLLQTMRQDSIRMLGEPSASDELLALLEPIEDFISAEIKATKSRNPKVRARAERRVLEIGSFFMPLMDCLYPIHLRAKSKLEELRPLVQEAIGQ